MPASIQRTLSIPLVIFLALLIPLIGILYANNPSAPTSTLYCVSSPATLTIRTLSPSHPRAVCIRVRDGIITELLDAPPMSSSESKHIVFLPGHVLPGLIDGHGHVLQYGEMLESVNLFGAESMAEVRRRVREFLTQKRISEGWGTREKWIRGFGWDQKYFGGVMPTADELSEDPLIEGHYISLDRVDVHCSLVSQSVLDLLPNSLPSSPPGGSIITDPGPGVFCDEAMEIHIHPLAPPTSTATKTNWITNALTQLSRVGITSVTDAGMRAPDVSLLESLLASTETNSLPVRLNIMLECTTRNSFCPDEFTNLSLIATSLGTPTPSLSLNGIKLFADGALGSHGAALLAPYSDDPSTSGTMLISRPSLTRVVAQWHKTGFQVAIHAIGDLANSAAIDAFEHVLSSSDNVVETENPNANLRFRIEHAQIMQPVDQWRLRRLGIIPSIQPTHATSDMAYAEERLGAERLKSSAYRMKSFFPQHGKGRAGSGYPGPILGSDFPVEPPNPFRGMYAAVTRKDPNTGLGEGWYMEETLTVEEALEGFTYNPAYGQFREGKVGRLEVGMWADFVVLDRDVLEGRREGESEADRGEKLRDVVVRQTWVGGRKVWDIFESEKAEKVESEEALEGHDEL